MLFFIHIAKEFIYLSIFFTIVARDMHYYIQFSITYSSSNVDEADGYTMKEEEDSL